MPEPRTAAVPAPRAWSLRTLMMLGNGVLLLLVSAVGTLLAWQNGDRAVDDLAGQIQARASAQVESHLQAYLDAPHMVTRLMADGIGNGEPDANDTVAMDKAFHRVLSLFPGISYVNIGLENGRFHGMGRVGNQSPDVVIEESGPPDNSVLHRFRALPGGQRGEPLNSLPFSDPRQQVWYREPRSRDAPVWSSIYAWVDNPEILVVSAGVPIHGAVEGVAGVDMFLSNIGDFLAGLHISPGARAYIVERDGMLVASSLGRMPFRRGVQGAERIHARDSGDEAMVQGIERLESMEGGLAAIREPLQMEFGLGERWYLSVTPWHDPRGLDWLIVVQAPEADFSQAVLASSRRATALGGLLLLLALGLSAVTAARIVRPLQRIQQAAQAIADGDLGVRVPPGSTRELRQLADSFNAMTERLAEARSELEIEVVRRTEELQRANEDLERLSREDSLTGLANRRCFDPRLREEWLRARRAGEELSLVLCDIDQFKAYNDRYGHSAGDEALRRVAQVLAASVKRPADLAARFGGEEFVLLLPGIGAQDAARFAAEIREHVLELAIPHEASVRGCVTLSFGIATHSPEAGYVAPDLLFKAADQALYRAKENGRDRIELASH